MKLSELRQLEAKATPGPWAWNVNIKSKRVVLESQNRGGMLEIVMDFVRYGMSGAKPRFLDQERCLMVPADELTKPIPGREHHESWARTISQPDADMIAAARNALPELLGLLEQCRRHIISMSLHSNLGLIEEQSKALLEKLES